MFLRYKKGKPVLQKLSGFTGNREKCTPSSARPRSWQDHASVPLGGAGMCRHRRSSVLFDGEDIAAKGLEHHRRNHISLIFQSYNLIDYMTPVENVRLTAKLDAAPILERLGLEQDETQRNVLKLSGGQQQRVAIARALASDAPVILADEPTGNLDADTAEEITAILKESAHAFGKCVVVVTHSGEVAKQADVVLEIKRGHLKEREM